MTLHDLGLLNRYWQKNPTLTMLVRGVAQSRGVEFTPQQAKPKPLTAEEARRWLAINNGLRSN